MRFYLKNWFVILLLIVSTALFFSVFFLSDRSTELELKQARVKTISGTKYAVGLTQSSRPYKGVIGAPITVVVFSDFGCSFCKEADSVLKKVFERYGERIYFQYRHFPVVKLHPFAYDAAEASMCADSQGKFWEYQEILFENQSDLSKPVLKNTAEILGLNMDEFASCLDNHTYRELIASDIKDGVSLGVSAAPVFFINGKKIQGAIPFDVWEKIVNSF